MSKHHKKEEEPLSGCDLPTIPLRELHEAIRLALDAVAPQGKSEMVSLFDADGRILAQPVLCQKPLPAFHNSAMDGYAVKRADAGKTVPFDQTIFAGDNPEGLRVTDGMCHKIMTGAMVPAGADAVVPFEDAEVLEGNKILLPEKIKENANIRFRGEESDLNDVLLEPGTLLSPGMVALIASQGITAVPVMKKLSVGVFSTGNELAEPWDAAADHQIYNSNSLSIYASVKALGCDATYLGVLPDDMEKLEREIEKLGGYDVIFTSGGVSVGEADFTEKAFTNAGMKTLVHGIAVKPGKHGLFGLLGDTLVFGLPGNPLSALTTLMTFCAPVIAKRQGRSAYAPTVALAKNKNPFAFKGRRANIILGSLDNGAFTATRNYKYGSGMLAPVAESDCFIIAPKGVEEFKKGDLVKVVFPYRLDGQTLELYSDSNIE